jgi:hypothetical protein
VAKRDHSLLGEDARRAVETALAAGMGIWLWPSVRSVPLWLADDVPHGAKPYREDFHAEALGVPAE